MQEAALRPRASVDAAAEYTTGAIRAVALGVVAVVFLITLPSIFLTINGSRVGMIGLVLVTAHQVITVVGLTRMATNRWLFWLSGALLVSSYALLMTHWNLDPGSAPWAPGFLGFSWVAWASGVLDTRWLMRLVLGFFGSVTLLDAALVALANQPGRELLISLWYVVPPLVMALFGYALRLVAAGVEQETQRRVTSLDSTEWKRHELHAHAEAARLLHDHILHALHAVARVGGEITPRMARDECATALEAVTRPQPTGRTASVGDLLADEPLVDQLSPRVIGDTGRLPADVAAAMAGAVHAALANVRQHARASQVVVSMQSEPRPRVQVTDDGAGFTPSRIPLQRLGLSRSIHGRMEDVGGSAEVLSAPRQGTTVTLTWPREDGSPDQLWVAGTQRQIRRLLIQTAQPGFAVTVVAALLAGLGMGQQVLALGSLLPVVVGLFYSRVLERRPATRLDEVVLLVVSLASWWGLLQLAPETTQGHAVHGLWFLWACSALLHLVVLQRPVQAGVVMVLLWVALASLGLSVSRAPYTVLAALPVVLVPLGEGLATVAVLARARRLEALQLDERRVTTRTRQEVATKRRASQLEDYWSEQVTGEAMPLIREIASGQEVTPERIRHAELLEATLRDELLLGPEQTVMLQVLNTLRRRGWHANTPSVTPDERGFLDAVAFWLARIGQPVRHRQEVKVTISRGMATLVVLEPDGPQLELWRQTADKLGAELDVGPGFARLRAPLPDHPSGRY